MRKRPENTCCSVIEPTAAEPSHIIRAARRAKALGDPIRVEILQLIAAQDDPLCACDIVDRYGKSQSTISHHLKLLTEAEVVHCQRSGLWRFYKISALGTTLLRILLNPAN
ncbi:MAG: metalloregulator ArsR/SmtB family transcription factor [Verrucomicrobiota bacterium]